jgi:cytochrome P450
MASAESSRTNPLRNAPRAVRSGPAVPGLPLLGNLLEFRRDRLALQDAAAALGPIGRFSIGPFPIYVVTDADLAWQVLVDDDAAYRRSAGLHFLRPMLGDGLLTAEGELRKRHRKLLAPVFTPRRLAMYAEAMVDEAKRQVARWQPGQRIDLAADITEMTLAIAGKTMFGADVRGDAHAVAQGLEIGMRANVESLTSVIQLGYAWPLPRHLRMRRAVKMLDEVVYRMIANGRRAGVDRGDVLSMLLLAQDDETGTGLTDAEVRDEVMTLLLAGHETTATALTWTWYELGKNPDALVRLVEESAQVLGTGDAARDVTFADLVNLPWNLAVIEEAMRLHPPAYLVGREAEREVTLGGHRLPARSIVAVNVRGLHRRADYFPAPLAFRPERMLPDAKKARPRSHYLPFGAGPRVCIGSHFALLEAQLALATMIVRARIEPLAAHLVPEPLVTLRPRGELPVRVFPRSAVC